MDEEQISLPQHENRSQRRYEELLSIIRRLEQRLEGFQQHQGGSMQARGGGSRQDAGWTEPMTARQHLGRMQVMEQEQDERLSRLEECVYRLERHLRQLEQLGLRAMEEGYMQGQQRGGGSRGYAREVPYQTGSRDIPRQYGMESQQHYGYVQPIYPGIGYLPYY